MKIQYHIWSFILPVLVFLGFELILFQPSAVFFVVPALFLGVFLAVYSILGRKLKTKSSRWYFWLPLAIFYLSAFSLFFLLESFWFSQLLVVFGAVLTGLFLESIYTYIWDHEWYEAYSLENISGYLNSSSIFFISASLIGFATFMQISIWLMLIPICILSFLLSWQTFWISKISWQMSRFFILALTLILTELFLVVSLLPVHFFISGAVMLITWYTFIGISKAHLLNFWRQKMVIRYLIIDILLLSALLSLTPWV